MLFTFYDRLMMPLLIRTCAGGEVKVDFLTCGSVDARLVVSITAEIYLSPSVNDKLGLPPIKTVKMDTHTNLCIISKSRRNKFARCVGRYTKPVSRIDCPVVSGSSADEINIGREDVYCALRSVNHLQ